MSRIHVLPDQVANQIAAGEVIERPAAVVKELIENSIDAGATRIAVSFKDGGKSLIRIEDNGSGMSPEEARLCIQRHATSKLLTTKDLDSIHTFGFRGEALPSIASVSRFSLKTQAEGQTEGHELFIQSGDIQYERACARAQGTTVEVTGLFHSVPARRKFLKTEATESAHIVQLCRLYALANPKISFTLTENGRLVFKSPPCEQIEERIHEIWGRTLTQKLLKLDPAEADGLKLHGFIGKPGESRSSRHEIITFINGRPVESTALNSAIKEAYQTYLSKGRSPIALLFLGMDPSSVDVNVHPAKREVRLRSEGLVRSFVLNTLGNCLQNAIEETRPKSTFQRTSELNQPNTAAPAPRSTDITNAPKIKARIQPLEPTFKPVTAPAKQVAEPKEIFKDATEHASFAWNYLGNCHKHYLLFESEEGIIILDARTAEQRLFFESLIQELNNKKTSSQPLLFPETLELSPAAAVLLTEHSELLRTCGFDIEPFGKSVFRIDALPSWLSTENASEFIQAYIDYVEEHASSLKKEQLAHDSFAKLASRYASQAPLPESKAQANALAQRLLATENPLTSPDGKRAYMELPMVDIQKKLS